MADLHGGTGFEFFHDAEPKSEKESLPPGKLTRTLTLTLTLALNARNPTNGKLSKTFYDASKSASQQWLRGSTQSSGIPGVNNPGPLSPSWTRTNHDIDVGTPGRVGTTGGSSGASSVLEDLGKHHRSLEILKS